MYSKSCIVRAVLTHRYATSRVGPSVDDDQRPEMHNPPGPAPYQVAPLQSYGSVPNPYPTTSYSSHSSPHALVPPQAFPPHQRASTRHPYTAQHASPSQPRPSAPGHWVPPPSSITNSDSGNFESSTVGGSYNNPSTRTDYRANAQVAAQTSNAPAFYVQNLLNASGLWFHKCACHSRS